ncbi:hypothetical protein MBLNU230_g2070t1 [Neophaeotheca triangularis]
MEGHQQTPSTCTPLDTMSQEQQQFLKLEDVQHSVAGSPCPSSYDMSPDSSSHNSQTSPAPVFVTSKPAKKRKSWGQTLPEPKTTLPPRKRAKTDDEKEQRRIERIKRNRAAAHNSRERKRQETETLAVQVAKLTAKLNAYEQLHGPLPASVVLPEVTLRTEDGGTPVPSLTGSRASIDESALSPCSPNDDLHDMNVHIKQEPTDSNGPTLYPSLFETPDEKQPSMPAHSTRLDSTQHSAAMLCDLQCRSSPRSSSTGLENPHRIWASLILYLLNLQMQTCYKSILLAIWTLSPSRMTRLVQTSTMRLASLPNLSTSPLTTSSRNPLLLRVTALALAQRNAATGLASSLEGAHALQRQSLDSLNRESMAGKDRQAGGHCMNQESTTHGMNDEESNMEGQKKGVWSEGHSV